MVGGGTRVVQKEEMAAAASLPAQQATAAGPRVVTKAEELRAVETTMEVLAASSVMAAEAEAVVMETMTVSTVAAEAEATVMETMMVLTVAAEADAAVTEAMTVEASAVARA